MHSGISLGISGSSVCASADGLPEYDFTVGSYTYVVSVDPIVYNTIYGYSRYGAEPYPDDYGTLSPNTFEGDTIIHFGEDLANYAIIQFTGLAQVAGVTDLRVTVNGVTEDMTWVGGSGAYRVAAAGGTLVAAIEAADGTTVTATIEDIT